MKSLIVTADDLGLSEKINEGIFLAYEKGPVTCTSLLIHAPGTEDALQKLKNYPHLQVGIHLAVVESFSMSKIPSLLSSVNYFSESTPCLPMNWKEFFINQILLGKFSTQSWEKEFELQIIKFLDHFGSIPFINSTQHLHLYPDLLPIVVKLCQKYKISNMRGLRKQIYSGNFSKRPIHSFILSQLSKNIPASLVSTNSICGVDEAGQLDAMKLQSIFRKLENGINELVVHPGKFDEGLVTKIPQTYNGFQHEKELKGLMSIQFNEKLGQFPV